MSLGVRIRVFVEREKLFLPTDRLLLACSGGLDSVVLAHLLRELGHHFALAHYNFQLRGEESDEDQRFVKQLGELDFKVPVFCERSKAEERARELGKGIQEVARDLRYDWLERIRSQEGFDYLLTAHHLDDNVETFLLNFLRGTGPIGLSGMLPRRGTLVRPLLETGRAELEAYAEAHRLNWREDRSNATDTYRRNYLRHHVLPHLRELQPAWEEVMAGNFRHLRQGRRVYRKGMEARWLKALDAEGHFLRSALPADPDEAFGLLRRNLMEYGFTPDQIRQLLSARTGSRIRARHRPENEALPTAERINLYLGAGLLPVSYVIRELPAVQVLERGKTLKVRLLPHPVGLRVDPARAYLSPTAVQLPLTLRHWRPGDRFRPFGMGGQSKKLQDFFVDQKLDRHQKDRVWLLENGDGEILWVVGHRMSEVARVKEGEGEVVVAELNMV